MDYIIQYKRNYFHLEVNYDNGFFVQSYIKKYEIKSEIDIKDYIYIREIDIIKLGDNKAFFIDEDFLILFRKIDIKSNEYKFFIGSKSGLQSIYKYKKEFNLIDNFKIIGEL